MKLCICNSSVIVHASCCVVHWHAILIKCSIITKYYKLNNFQPFLEIMKLIF